MAPLRSLGHPDISPYDDIFAATGKRYNHIYEDPSGYSVTFSGNDQGLTVPDDDAWNLGTTFTIEAFINPTGTLKNYNTIVSQSDGGDNWYMSVISSGKLQFYDFSGGENRESAAGVISADSGWYHVALVNDDGNCQWYVNGTASGSGGSLNVAGGSNGLKIGRQSTHNFDWEGSISNLRITNSEALYTSNFTAPSSNLTLTSQGATASNVALLCCNKSTVTGSTKTPGTIATEGSPTVGDGPF